MLAKSVCMEQDEALEKESDTNIIRDKSSNVDELLHDRQQHCKYVSGHVSHACWHWSGSTRSVFC